MSPNIHFNKRNSNDYLNDKRNFSFKFLIPVIVFALIVFSVVYFYRKSNEREMINAFDLMINDLENYIQSKNIIDLESLITYKKSYKRYMTTVDFEFSSLKDLKNYNDYSINTIKEGKEVLINQGEIFGDNYELVIYKNKNSFGIIAYAESYDYSIEKRIN